MKKRMSFHSKLMLLELALVIGFFAVFAAVCLRIIISAHQTSEKNVRLTNAIIAVENAAECFKAGKDPIIFYDGDWNPAEESEAAYIVEHDFSSQDGFSTVKIKVRDEKGGEIFSLTVNSLKAAGQ